MHSFVFFFFNKLQCDRQTPSCGQCIRAGRPCAGYRSELDLMFRNESEAVAGKAKAREKAKTKVKQPVTQDVIPPAPESFDFTTLGLGVAASSIFHSDENRDIFFQSMLPYSSLHPTLEERGLGCFNACSPTWLRHPDLLDDVCKQDSSQEHLIASMNAVGLATLSNAVHAPELMVRARKDYVHALQLTNLALRSPVEAKKDTTLFAVMILGIFETITGNNDRSLAAWTEHINGAAALVKLRGTDQLQTVVGQRMFLQVTANLMLSCVQRTVAMPQHIIDLRKEALTFMDPDNPGWRTSGVIIDYTIFRAGVRDCRIVGPKAVIEAALELDRRFIEIFNDLAEVWTYETKYSDETPHLIWNGSYHVYKETWMAHLYNGVRTCRIMLHETVRDQLLAASTALSPIFPITQMIKQGQSSVSIMLEMQAQILASIPHDLPAVSIEVAPALWAGSRSYFVLWPLYVVGAMDLTTEPIRKWAVARLRDIGETSGIRQALLVANYLESGKWIRVWDTKPDPDLQRKYETSDEQRKSAHILDEEEDQEIFQSHIEKELPRRPHGGMT
jgi:hypothetical protein